MISTMRYGLFIWNRSSSNALNAVRNFEWFDSYDAALAKSPRDGGGFIIDIKKPCRLCDRKYYDDIHLVDGQTYDFSTWGRGDKRHWFID